MLKLELNGQWEVHETGKNEFIPANVPGTIHLDLLAAGKIPDPYFRDNELSLQWIGETSWTYFREFSVSEKLLKKKKRESILFRL